MQRRQVMSKYLPKFSPARNFPFLKGEIRRNRYSLLRSASTPVDRGSLRNFTVEYPAEKNDDFQHTATARVTVASAQPSRPLEASPSRHESPAVADSANASASFDDTDLVYPDRDHTRQQELMDFVNRRIERSESTNLPALSPTPLTRHYVMCVFCTCICAPTCLPGF